MKNLEIVKSAAQDVEKALMILRDAQARVESIAIDYGRDDSAEPLANFEYLVEEIDAVVVDLNNIIEEEEYESK